MQIGQARPPYVDFETRAVEQRHQGPPVGDGATYWINVDFAIVTPQGSKDRFEKKVDDWIRDMSARVKADMYPQAWLTAHQEAYQYWKKHNDLPLDGTPIKGWPLTSAAEQAKLLSLNVKTVEDLAQANVETVGRLGMGGLTLKQRAENFLKARQDTGPLVSRLEALAVTLESTNKQLAQVMERNAALEHQITLMAKDRGMPSPVALDSPPMGTLESRLADAQSKTPDFIEEVLGS